MAALVEGWSAALEDAGLTRVAVDDEDALLAVSLDWDHRDPFDRLLAAQALRRGVPLVTVDRALRDLPGLPTISW